SAIAICALCSSRQPGSYWSGSGQSIGTAMGSEPSLGAKMLELLNEIAPHVELVAICPTQMLTRPVGSLRRWLRLRGLRVEVVTAPIRGSNEIEAAMAQWGSEPNFGLIVVPDPAMKQDREMAEDVRFGS